MTDAELSALEAAAKAATPGPWYNIGCSTIKSEITHSDIVNDEDCFLIKDDDCAFIAAANPSAVLDLIAELRQARRERDWLAKYIAGLKCPEIAQFVSCDFAPRGSTPKCIECWLKEAKEATCKD